LDIESEYLKAGDRRWRSPAPIGAGDRRWRSALAQSISE